MTTQPMNEYLNRERLTDLAQFAVPDGHDLWPKIEQAARASASGITPPRSGVLSMGLSRAWTAVGVLLIAATFAALGFGLAVLVLSNGHDQVPAAPVTPTVTPTVDSTSTPAPTPDVSFEDSLSSDDLARFQTLPVEILEALAGESLESSNDSALLYLRDMPDDPPPLAEILDPESRALFDKIDDPYRRELLLKGYPNSTVRYLRKQWLAGDLTDLEYKYGNFDVLVRGVLETLSEGHVLPPLEEALSSAALKRYESLDPILQESFRLVWETTRSHSVDDKTDELEQDLLKVPLELPGIRDLGLPSEAVGVLERELALSTLAQRMVAGEIVYDQNWDADDAAFLQRTIAAHEAPGGKDALERGLLPGGSGHWLPLLCNSSSAGGVPLDKAVRPVFRDLHPAQLVYAWPEPEDVLSDKALANLNLLDETMLEAFEVRWYGHGVPLEARFMACLIAHWERGLVDILYTSMPGPDVLLPEDKRPLYDELTDHEKWAINLNLAHDILKGEVLFKRERFATQTEHVSTFDATPEEFLEGLRFKAVEWLCGFHPTACREATPTPTVTPTTTLESWVSENGFIQFTTGDEPLDEPLPGTHFWCFPPTQAPDDPGPWLVPSKLPEGMKQTVRNQLSQHHVLRAFQSSTARISMSQSLCATRKLNPLTYKEIQVGYRTAYVTAAVRPSADGATPEFDPNVARSLVMDIGYGVVGFNVFGSVTVDELVSMAASLVPEELTGEEAGSYPQVVLDALGTSFGPVYVPGKLPDGYEMFGQLIPQPLGDVKATQLTYMRTRGNDCHFYLRQAAPGQRFPDVAVPAVVIDGFTLKTTHKPPLRPAEQYTTVHFKHEDVWIGVMINRSSNCDHSLEMVAEIAASLEPLQP